MKKNIEEKAKNYINSVVLSDKTYRGDVETAYIIGASDALDISDSHIQKLSEELYDNLGSQVRFCEEILWFLNKIK